MCLVYTVNILNSVPDFGARLKAYFNLPAAPPSPPSDENLENLKAVCAVLNLPEKFWLPIVEGQKLSFNKRTEHISPGRIALRKLVEEWMQSGPNTELMMQKNPSLWKNIEHITIALKPTKTGAVRIDPFGIPRENQGLTDFESLVYAFFLMLIMNPYWNRLGGPCARCDKYYIKKTKRQKVYCSKRCGPLHTSVNCNRKRRQARHQKKVEKARKFISKWESVQSRRDWKKWVSEKTGITTNWLTRAVNTRELIEPAKRDR
jgi:hypothetical protein